MIEAAVFDRSDNLLAGFPTVKRAEVFLQWLERRSPGALADVRVIAYDESGDEQLIYPQEAI